MFASRNIILSLRCLIGDAVSEERDDEFCDGFGRFATPLELLLLAGRWVMGLVP
jgi:hypothetical protein